MPIKLRTWNRIQLLVKSQLVFGDKTELKPRIVLALDGSVNVSKTFRAQLGDSFVITKDGYEQLIEFSIDLGYVVIKKSEDRLES